MSTKPAYSVPLHGNYHGYDFTCPNPVFFEVYE